MKAVVSYPMGRNLVLVLALSLASAAWAPKGAVVFPGEFAPGSNWNPQTQDGAITMDPSTLVITGPGGDPTGSERSSIDVMYFLGPTMPLGGRAGVSVDMAVSFHYRLEAGNSLSATALFGVGVDSTSLGSTAYGGATVEGDFQTTLNRGDQFAFALDSQTYKGTAAKLTITDFTSLAAVPEASVWWAGSALIGIMGWRKWRAGVRASRPPPVVLGLCILAFANFAALGASANASVSLNVPSPVFIGNSFSIGIAFTNTSTTQPGYGPFVDLAFESVGTSGRTSGAPFDAISIPASGAVTYQGQAVTYQTVTFNDTANGGLGIPHPYAKTSTGGPLYVKTTDYGAAGRFVNGDALLVALLPFGSFTPNQPTAALSVSATLSSLANVGTALSITSRGGFQFGNTPLDDPAADPSLLGATTSASIGVTGTLITLSKNYLGPENETATGPNFPRQYRIDVNVADGQVISNLVVQDVLPAGIQFVSLDSLTGGTVASQTLPSTTSPGGTLSIRFNKVTGPAGGGTAASVLFSFFAPRLDSSAQVLLNAATGAQAPLDNQALCWGDWQPVDVRDAPSTVLGKATAPGTPDSAPEHTLIAKSIAVQKSVVNKIDTGSSGYTPGDTLEYTLQFQISDYFAFRNLRIQDLLSDGQHFDPGFTPTLSITEHGSSTSGDIASGNFLITTNFTVGGASGHLGNPPRDGTTTLTFLISDELTLRGFTVPGVPLGTLPGGGVDQPFNGPYDNPSVTPPVFPALGGTVGTLKFRAVIQDAYTDDFPSGEPALDSRDSLSDTATAAGDLVDVATLIPNGNSQSDGSSAAVSIATPSLTKSIYAINGNTTYTSTNVRPGDTVCYRLRYTLPTGDVEQFALKDYLPLPVFNVADPLANGTAPGWTLDASPTSTPPPPGHVAYGQTDSFSGPGGISHIAPAISTDTSNGANTLIVTYGNFSNAANTAATVDILFTITVNTQPFADALLLMNQGESSEQNTRQPGAAYTTTSIVPFTLNEPSVTVYKGVVGSTQGGGVTVAASQGSLTFDPPGNGGFTIGSIASLADAQLVGTLNLTSGALPDAADKIRFATVLLNNGRSDAYGVAFSDTIPTGFVNPNSPSAAAFATAANLKVQRGDGTLLTLGTDYTLTWTAATGVFAITLMDNNPALPGTGSLNRGFNADTAVAIADGSNAAVITFDLALASSVQPSVTLTNTALLAQYKGAPTGANFLATPLADSAVLQTATPTLAKTLVATEINTPTNGLAQAAIGELVDYAVTIALPEGITPSVVVTDTLHPGMTFVSLLSTTLSSGVTRASAAPTVAMSNVNGGANNRVVFTCGNVTNANTDNSIADTLTLTYRAVVLNVAGNVGGASPTQLTNGASLAYTGGSTLSASAPPISVIEPRLSLTKQVSADNASYANTLAGQDAGDTVFYRLILTNPAGSTNTTAYDLSLSDPFPAQVTGLSVVSVDTTGTFYQGGGGSGLTSGSYPPSAYTPVPADFGFTGSTLNLLPSNLHAEMGSSLTVVVQGTLAASVTPGQSIANTATLRWSSLNGTYASARTANSANSTERSGSGGVNTYTASNTAGTGTITIAQVVPTKSIIATSEAHTSEAGDGVATTTARALAIAEIVRFRLATLLPEGTITNLQILDNLPAGLTFVNDSQVKIAFVANGPSGITSTTLSGAGLSVSGSSPVTPTFTLPPAAITGSPFADGTDPVFLLGDVVNTDSDADAEYVVIEFNAVVSNIAANTTSRSLSNTFATRRGTTVLATSATMYEVVQQPALTIAKAASVTSMDAGDTVVFTVTITASGVANTTTAFDVSVTDLVPSALTVTGISAPATTGTVLGATSSLVGNTVTLAATSMATNSTLSLTITNTTSGSVSAGQTITNAATVVWTSLPGASGTTGNSTGSDTPGTTGTGTGERNGTGGVNAYTATATRVVTILPPTIDKTWRDGSLTEDDTSIATTYLTNVVVGETLTYDIKVNLSEGTNRLLRVVDTIPAGLRLDSYELVTTNGASPGLAGRSQMLSAVFSNGTNLTNLVVSPALPTIGPADVTFTFGDVFVSADNVAGNNAFVIRIVATALDTLTNQAEPASTLHTNTARLVYLNASTGLDATINDSTPANNPISAIIEPLLSISKSLNTTSADAGDSVIYTLAVTNGYSVTNTVAYAVTLSDVLPVSLASPTILNGTGDFVVSDVAVRAASTANIAGTFTSGIGNPGTFTGSPLTLDGVTLAVGDRVLLKNQTTSARNGVYTVTAVGATTSLARTPAFDTETEFFRGARVLINEGTANAGTTYWITSTVTTLNTSAVTWTLTTSFTKPTATDFQVTSGPETTSLGVKAPFVLNIPPGRGITLKVQGTLAATVNPAQAVTNLARILWNSAPTTAPDRRTGDDDPSTTNTSPNPAILNNYAVASSPAVLSIPGIAASKTFFSSDQASTTDPSATIGENVTFALKVSLPEGTTPSFSVTDAIPPGMAFVSYSLVTTAAASGGLLSTDFTGSIPTPAVTGGAGNGSQVGFTFGPIAATASATTQMRSFLILVTARVLDVSGNVGVATGQTTLTNTADFDVPGDAQTTITSSPILVPVVEPLLIIGKTMSPTNADAGELVTITLTVQNAGLASAFETSVRDVLDGSRFDLATANIGSPGAQYPATFTGSYTAANGTALYQGGPLAQGAVASFVISARLLPNATPGLTITNTAEVLGTTTLPGSIPGERTEPPSSAAAVVTIFNHSLSGFVYGDLNNNGIRDPGEPVFQGIGVQLSGSDAQGRPVSISVTTGIGGQYLFTNLAPSSPSGYTLTRTSMQSGWNDGKETVGTSTSSPRFGGTADNTSGIVTITSIVIPPGSNSDGADYNFGLTASASISGRVYRDNDLDGLFSSAAGDNGISGVTVQFNNGAGTTFASTTDASGQFSHPVTEGTWTLTLSGSDPALAGLRLSTDSHGEAHTPASVTVSLGGSATQNFAYIQPVATLASLSRARVSETPGGTTISWETASEIGSVSFDVYRTSADSGERRRINNAPIPANGSPTGAGYTIQDNQHGQQISSSSAPTYSIVENDQWGRLRLIGSLALGTELGAQNQPAATPPTQAAVSASGSAEGTNLRRQAGLHLATPPTPISLEDLAVSARIRVITRVRGPHRIAATDLATLLGQPEASVTDWIAAGSLVLSNRGQLVNWSASSDHRSIHFQAEAIKNNFADANVYWLSSGTNTMVPVDGGTPSPLPDATYETFVRVEQDLLPTPTLASDPRQDLWMWKKLLAGTLFLDTATFPISLTGTATNAGVPAKLRLRLVGANSVAHRVNVEFNGTTIAQASWQGTAPAEHLLSIPPSLLKEGANQVRLKALVAPSGTGSQWYLDWIDLAYQRSYTANAGILEGAADGNPIVSIDGFSSTNVVVWDTSQPNSTRLVRELAWDTTSRGWRLSFKPESRNMRFAAFEPDSASSVISMELSRRTDLSHASNEGACVVVAPDSLMDAAQQLVSYRASQGLACKLVRLKSVYDEFSDGIPSPDALRAFLRTAVSNWRTPPKYALLAGNGTYDYRDLLHNGDCLVPPSLVPTSFGLFASDSVLGDINGDGIPEVAVGRLPATTPEELAAMIAKIIAYEADGIAAAPKALLLADSPDSGGQFAAEIELAATSLTGTLHPILVRATGLQNLPETRAAIQTALGTGVDLVAYLGHGAIDRLGGIGQGYLSSADLPALALSPRLPVLLAGTCVAGQYSVPGYNCLAETLVLASKGGAIAVVAPSGLSWNSDASRLNLRLIRGLDANSRPRLGDTFRVALGEYSRADSEQTPPWIYNLIGDPALLYQVPGRPQPTNQPPHLTWRNSASGTLSAPATLTLRVDAFDTDGRITRVQYFEGADLAGQSDAYPFEMTLQAVGAGQHTYIARATDEQGATVESELLTLDVSQINNRPTISLGTPRPATAVFAEPVAMDVSASDADGQVLRIEIREGEDLLLSTEGNPAGVTLDQMPAGHHTIHAIAIDNQGAVGRSADVELEVLPFSVSIETDAATGGTVLKWTGGRPPFFVERCDSLGLPAAWQTTTAPLRGTNTVLSPLRAPAGYYYRLRGSE